MSEEAEKIERVSKKIAAIEVLAAEQKNIRSCMVGIVGALLAAAFSNIAMVYGGVIAFCVAAYLGYIMAKSREKAKYLNDKYVLGVRV